MLKLPQILVTSNFFTPYDVHFLHLSNGDDNTHLTEYCEN